MTVFTFINAFFHEFLWMIGVIFLIQVSRGPVIKGYLGELVVRFCVHIKFDKNIYHRLHNVTLPTLDGTTQVDHILVSKFGNALVIRAVSKGDRKGKQFWGCSGYPKCRTIQSI